MDVVEDRNVDRNGVHGAAVVVEGDSSSAFDPCDENLHDDCSHFY